MIGCELHPHIERSAVRLTDNRELGSPLQAQTTVVDGAVWGKREAQLAAQLTWYIALDDGASAGAEANVGDNIKEANAEGISLRGWDRLCRSIPTEGAGERGQQTGRAKPRHCLPSRHPIRQLPRKRIELARMHGVLLSCASVAAVGSAAGKAVIGVSC